ncbi:unnamed protein product [marine sediment metagenome]|uniref:Uncharacterized protein n=1 Tax=marine sediment metagenome TaxID=412755 RepID=X0VKS4_9ZZZZ
MQFPVHPAVLKREAQEREEFRNIEHELISQAVERETKRLRSIPQKIINKFFNK